MDNEKFIEILFELRKSVTNDLLSVYNVPPGRKPEKRLLSISNWYKSLSEVDQNNIKIVMYDSMDAILFHFLCILDHVSFIEDDEEKTKFELYASKNGQKQLLNSEDQEELHNIYNYLSKNDPID